jgi:hypothetical protein
MELYEVVGWAFLALIMGFIALVGIATWRQMLREAREAGLLPERRDPLTEGRSPRGARRSSARAREADPRRRQPG